MHEHGRHHVHLPTDVGPRTFWILLILAWSAIIVLCTLANPTLGTVALLACLGAVWIGARVDRRPSALAREPAAAEADDHDVGRARLARGRPAHDAGAAVGP